MLQYWRENKLLICICSQREIANDIIDTFTLSTVTHRIRGQFLKMHSTDTTARFNTIEAKQSYFVDMSSPLILHNMQCQDCSSCGILDLDTTQTSRCIGKHTAAIHKRWMDAVHSSKMLLPTHQTIRCLNPEYHNMNLHTHTHTHTNTHTFKSQIL